MQKLSQEYLTLFNAITDAEEMLKTVCAQLLLAQRKAEEMYIRSSETPAEETPEKQQP